jgi:hypothetical protein
MSGVTSASSGPPAKYPPTPRFVRIPGGGCLHSPRARARTSWSEQKPARLAFRHSRPRSRPSALVTAARRRPAGGHRPAHFGNAGPCWHRAACESSQRRGGSIESLAPGDVIAFHDGLQVPRRADDQRGMNMIVAEEVPYLTDGGRQRMSDGSREHHLGGGAQHPTGQIRQERVPWPEGRRETAGLPTPTRTATRPACGQIRLRHTPVPQARQQLVRAARVAFAASHRDRNQPGPARRA